MKTLLAIVVGLCLVSKFADAEKRRPSSVSCPSVGLKAAIDTLWEKHLKGQGSNEREQISGIIVGTQEGNSREPHVMYVDTIVEDGFFHASGYRVKLNVAQSRDDATCTVAEVKGHSYEISRGPTENP